ncbi:uncharacterized protein [Diadema antillarum]|uniref:uncharacterized protein n=1 Tax=Diadema antillarum TaxID=105358 RepID=UPI003A88C820
MAASGLMENSTSQTKPEQLPSFNRSMGARSIDTSGSSVSSEVLEKSGINVLPHTKSRPSLDASDSSHSSTGSVRVRIKAKYLKERRSPFEKGDIAADQPQLPPALPSNLPEGYERGKDTADVYSNGYQATDLHSGIPGSPETSSKVSGSQMQSFPQSTPAGNHLKNPNKVPGEALTSGNNADTCNNGAPPSKVPFPVKNKEIYSSTKVKTAAKASGILRQGEVTTAMGAQGAQSGQSLDVRVIQYGSRGKRQQVMSEQLSKRHGNTRPTTRVVQPKLIASNKPTPSQSASTHPQSDSGSMVTASAAAAAAVAATVPLLKTQSDLESKMSHIMEKLSILEHAGHVPPPQPTWAYPQGLGWGVEGPGAQYRLEELTRLQLEHLEQLQMKQQELQAAMTELSRGNVAASTVTGPSAAAGPLTGAQSRSTTELSSQSASRDRQHARREARVASEPSVTAPGEGTDPSEMNAPMDRGSQMHTFPGTFQPELNKNNLNTADPLKPTKRVQYTRAVTFHGLSQGREAGVTSHDRKGGDDAPQAEALSQEDVSTASNVSRGTRSSPLDTPAPRRHAPVPHARGSRTRVTHLGKGLLEEILSSHDEDERTIAKRQGEKGTASSPQIGNLFGLRFHRDVDKHSSHLGLETRSKRLSQTLPVADKNDSR